MPYVSEVVVSGNGEKIQAELYLNEDMPEYDEKTANADIAELNTKIAFYKNISLVTFRKEPFPKTTTKKIIRNGTKEACLKK